MKEKLIKIIQKHKRILKYLCFFRQKKTINLKVTALNLLHKAITNRVILTLQIL